MNEVLKTAVIGIVATICVLLIKKDNPAGAYLLTIGTGVLIVLTAVNFMRPIQSFLDELSGAAELSPAILSPLFKVLGIGIVTKIAAESCRDAKESAIGAYVELAGATAALYVTLPLFSAVFSLIRSFAA